MRHRNIVLGIAALTAACTCELSLGPGAHDEAPTAPPAPVTLPTNPPVITRQAAAIDPGMKAKPTAPQPTGTLSEASIRKTAGRHKNEVSFCIEQAGTPSAKMAVSFLVLPDGSVHEPIEVIEQSDVSDKLKGCWTSALKRWKFEAPKGGAARATLSMHR